MRMRWACFGATVVVALTTAIPLCHAAGSAADPSGAPVAGTTPDRRPEGAPRITAFERTDAWYAKARAGVSEPYPASLNFLDDQGGWFTPFIRPGMSGPYDIRGLHAAKASTGH